MEVIIAGAGSIGLLLGSFLSEAKMHVTLFVRQEEQANLINAEGIRRIGQNGEEDVFRVKATTDISKLSTEGLWIIAVKYSGLRGLLSQMKEADVKNPVLFVQNGIGHLDLAFETDIPQIAFATVEHGALRTDGRTVSHNGTGMLTIAIGRGDASLFKPIEQASSVRFPVRHLADAEYVLLRKVLINCMINPLTAILQVENGELLTNSYCYELYKALYEELMNVFPELRQSLSLESVSDVCRNTARNKSSMLADRSAGRPMEIETIVTAVLRKAQSRGKSLPLLSMLEKMLYALDEKGAT